MDLAGKRTEELFHIITQEREQRSPEALSQAEAELIRRLGGTREAALKRLRRRGVVALLACPIWAAFLVLLVLRGIFHWLVLAAGGIGALIAVVRGLPLAWNPERAYRRTPDILGKIHCRALEHEPPVEDVLAVVRTGRPTHAKEEVAKAESEILDRMREAHRERAAKLKSWSTWAMGIGLLQALIGTVGCLFLWLSHLREELRFAARITGQSVGVALARGFWIPLGMMFPCALLGCGFLVAGLALRRRWQWARRLWVGLGWGFIGWSVGLMLAGFAVVIYPEAKGAELLLWLGAILLSVVLGLLAGWRWTTFLNRPETLEAIDPSLVE